ncbi:Dual-specificity protein-like phosphatase 1 [Rhynchospora pubera]|uniref:phosphatidylglycerophosphatase n=1 Tax=Rhynchospora pubera TaxID=906938 RepID=A0AAV8E5K0_9POAL|nr:Dual-specificity protein-like phosphatase 1 [Rhynchospora pubera]
MHIEELGDGEAKGEEIEISYNSKLGLIDAKRAAVGVGARMLFYPTLLYNVVRNTFEPQFHWWDRVDEFLLLGAVPFPSDVVRLKKLGVCGVITLNEPYETLVPVSLYNEHGIENLVLPTRDYLFAPSFENLCRAVDFIHRNATNKKMTYVHCKAGRGRSTTVVLCYLVQYKGMSPAEAFEYVRVQRPRVLLASSQWQAVQEFYSLRVLKVDNPSCMDSSIVKHHLVVPTSQNFICFDDSTFVVISQADMEGYIADSTRDNLNKNSILAELSSVCRLSYFWLRCQSQKKMKKRIVCDMKAIESCSLEAEQVGATSHCCLAQGVAVKL